MNPQLKPWTTIMPSRWDLDSSSLFITPGLKPWATISVVPMGLVLLEFDLLLIYKKQKSPEDYLESSRVDINSFYKAVPMGL